MANKFKDKTMRDQYEAAMFAYKTKHRNFFYPDGTRCLGNGFAAMFWRGFDGVPIGGVANDAYAKKTLAYAYWRAGQDAAKEVGSKDD